MAAISAPECEPPAPGCWPGPPSLGCMPPGYPAGQPSPGSVTPGWPPGFNPRAGTWFHLGASCRFLQDNIHGVCYSGRVLHSHHLPNYECWIKYEYRWEDGIIITESIVVSAPEYVEYLLNWIETHIDDETICPQNLVFK